MAFIEPDAGELEAIAILNERKIEGLKFCTIDRLAQKVVIYLGLETGIVAFETVLRDLGVSRKSFKTPTAWSEKQIADHGRDVKLGML